MVVVRIADCYGKLQAIATTAIFCSKRIRDAALYTFHTSFPRLPPRAEREEGGEEFLYYIPLSIGLTPYPILCRPYRTRIITCPYSYKSRPLFI